MSPVCERARKRDKNGDPKVAVTALEEPASRECQRCW
jgi:hypothetical protein